MALSSQLIDSHDEHLATIKQLFANKRFAYAEHLLETLLSKSNNDAQLHYLLGVTKAKQNKQQQALADFSQAIALDPTFPGGHNGLALALFELSEYKKAYDVCQKAEITIPPDKKFYTTYSKVLHALFMPYKAIELMEFALKKFPNEAQFWSNLAVLHAGTNHKDKAIECFQKALELAPRELQLHENIAEIKSYQSKDDPHIAEMEQCLTQALGTPLEANLAFGLARAFEKLKDYQQASHYYRQGNDIEARRRPYQHDSDLELAESIKVKFNTEFVRACKANGNSDPTPIFIVGMPRSGTSLAEQILASHSKVYGAGELEFVKECMAHGVGIINGKLTKVIELLEPDLIEPIAQNYLQRIRDFSNEAKYIVDKMPHNFRYVGLIHCLFPNAKIINCQRQKQDVFLSNFKTHFLANLSYSTNLNTCKQFYQIYENMMAYWHQLLPGVIYDLHYEKLIDNPEEETKNLLQYCDLPWQDQCLKFHQAERVVRTSSYLQVKQPLYSTSKDSWKNFEPYLPELTD